MSDCNFGDANGKFLKTGARPDSEPRALQNISTTWNGDAGLGWALGKLQRQILLVLAAVSFVTLRLACQHFELYHGDLTWRDMRSS